MSSSKGEGEGESVTKMIIKRVTSGAIKSDLPAPPPSTLRAELRSLFRRYDIRGIASVDAAEHQREGIHERAHHEALHEALGEWGEEAQLSSQLMYAIGCAYAAELKRRHQDSRQESHQDQRSGQHRDEPLGWVALGVDARLSGEALASALERGLRRGGLNVARLGLVPTPMVYFATHELELTGALGDAPCEGGLMVTGSHNPSAWNGLKLSFGTQSIYGDALQALADRVLSADYQELSSKAPPTEVITVDLTARYYDQLRARLSFGDRPLSTLKVVVDAGHGASGPLAMGFLSALGVQTRGLYIEPDGRFPAHHPDPTVEENLSDLKRAVLEWGADLGVGFDGDGDRIGVVDREGEVLWGDQLLLLFAQRVLRDHPGARIIGEVKCSQALYQGVRNAGGIGEMWRVGHSLIKARMSETGSPLAGEMSGHIFFADRFYGHDDALYAAARLLERLTEPEFDLAAWRCSLPPSVTTPELRVWCADRDKEQVIRRVVEHFSQHHQVNEIDGARIEFDGGWGLVRASNTQPVLVMRFEAESEARLLGLRSIVEDWLKAFAPEVRFDLDPDQ